MSRFCNENYVPIEIPDFQKMRRDIKRKDKADLKRNLSKLKKEWLHRKIEEFVQDLNFYDKYYHEGKCSCYKRKDYYKIRDKLKATIKNLRRMVK